MQNPLPDDSSESIYVLDWITREYTIIYSHAQSDRQCQSTLSWYQQYHHWIKEKQIEKYTRWQCQLGRKPKNR